MTIGKKSGFIWGMLILQEHMLILSWLSISVRIMIRPPLLTNMVFLLLKNIIRHHLLPEHIRGVARWRRLINRSTAIWQKAEEYVTTAGEINSAYITADVVKALKARIALEKRGLPNCYIYSYCADKQWNLSIDDRWRCLCRYVVA